MHQVSLAAGPVAVSSTTPAARSRVTELPVIAMHVAQRDDALDAGPGVLSRGENAGAQQEKYQSQAERMRPVSGLGSFGIYCNSVDKCKSLKAVIYSRTIAGRADLFYLAEIAENGSSPLWQRGEFLISLESGKCIGTCHPRKARYGSEVPPRRKHFLRGIPPDIATFLQQNRETEVLIPGAPVVPPTTWCGRSPSGVDRRPPVHAVAGGGGAVPPRHSRMRA